MNNSKRVIIIFSFLGGLIGILIHLIDASVDYADTAPIDDKTLFIVNSNIFYKKLLLFLFIGVFLGFGLGKFIIYLKTIL